MVGGAVGRQLQLAARPARPIPTRSENHTELLAELAKEVVDQSPRPPSITVALRPEPLTLLL